MVDDAIKAALEASREAWAEVQDGAYMLDAEQKIAVQAEIDNSILALEEAARLALVETV